MASDINALFTLHNYVYACGYPYEQTQKAKTKFVFLAKCYTRFQGKNI
jgi:hypothetical protein